MTQHAIQYIVRGRNTNGYVCFATRQGVSHNRGFAHVMDIEDAQLMLGRMLQRRAMRHPRIVRAYEV